MKTIKFDEVIETTAFKRLNISKHQEHSKDSSKSIKTFCLAERLYSHHLLSMLFHSNALAQQSCLPCPNVFNQSPATPPNPSYTSLQLVPPFSSTRLETNGPYAVESFMEVFTVMCCSAKSLTASHVFVFKKR